MILNSEKLSVSVDFKAGYIRSLSINGKERLAAPSPVFSVRLRDTEGNTVTLTSHDAKNCTEYSDGALYTDFSEALASVRVYLTETDSEANLRIAAVPKNDSFLVECVDFPSITLPAFKEDAPEANGGSVLFPYNEGVLISNSGFRKSPWWGFEEAKYPSKGNYYVFPNMICSQMLAYIWDDASLYIGAHDAHRGVKEVDFFLAECGVTLRFRIFCGVGFGESFEMDYPVVLAATEGRWEAAAERYRRWFESSLPEGVKKIRGNPALPEWYSDSPLIVTYPVRGVHDMDEMKPNALFPYTAALPLLDRIKLSCESRLLVILMHWEGTAPWAPPFVWPPYGGVENFDEFKKALRKDGNLLGVYCSGFGYTIKSNLIEEYDKTQEYKDKELWRGMCAAPNGEVSISNICQGQRSGYDICPASSVGKELLDEGYRELLNSDLDYIQILDQNHGGGQYFCYSKDHGHPPAPGAWMTENMQKLLGDWNATAKGTLLGCESAAAEPFIGNLLFSDNRYELNYNLGTPVPLYSYVYHEYLHNFMGNQVCCPFKTERDTLRFRLAYSFSIGDNMTLVLTPDGNIASHWGLRDFSNLPDKDAAFRMIANLTRFYKEQAKPFLYDGKMIAAPSVECRKIGYEKTYTPTFTTPAVLSTAWQSADGKRAVVLVNPNETDEECRILGKEYTVPALNAILISL